MSWGLELGLGMLVGSATVTLWALCGYLGALTARANNLRGGR